MNHIGTAFTNHYKNYKQLHQELMSCEGGKGDDTQFYGNLNYFTTSSESLTDVIPLLRNR